VLDPARWPHATAFLDALPQGFDSFPECECLRETYEGARARVREGGDPGALPGPVQRYFDEDEDRKWIPEVIGLTLQMMMFDLEGEEAGVQWFYDDAKRIFEGPIMRFLMKLMSPTLVVMGASSRWGALRRGSTLTASPVKKDTEHNRAIATLEFPDGLYPELFLRGLEQSFKAAVDGARGNDVDVKLTNIEPGRAAYEVTWAR
jgi:hypothetical protein